MVHLNTENIFMVYSHLEIHASPADFWTRLTPLLLLLPQLKPCGS
jgi:hypothetical protein